MRHRNLVIAWIAFALPVLVLAAAIWRGPGDAAAQQKIVWKVQSAWPANNLLHISAVELAKRVEGACPHNTLVHISAVELAKMVENMSGAGLKWEMSAAGTVVPAFEILD